jgi:hypothetical protein
MYLFFSFLKMYRLIFFRINCRRVSNLNRFVDIKNLTEDKYYFRVLRKYLRLIKCTIKQNKTMMT